MTRIVLSVCAAAAVAVFALGARGATRPKASKSAVIQRGEYLVTIGGCNDCHTPWKMGANGPEQDMSRMLSGHPEGLEMPASPQAAPPWGIAVSGTFTAWAGPWGTSFTANLTPDRETGLGGWTERNFVEAMRTGRHQGRGRPMLPPMPWFNYSKMTDADLHATFAYLRSIPAIRNRVPDPILNEPGPRAAEAGPPAGAAQHGTGGSSQGAAPDAPPQPRR